MWCANSAAGCHVLLCNEIDVYHALCIHLVCLKHEIVTNSSCVLAVLEVDKLGLVFWCFNDELQVKRFWIVDTMHWFYECTWMSGVHRV